MPQPALAPSADELVHTGRISEAVKVLSEQNRARRDGDVETRIVELRRDSPLPDVSTTRGRRWPPRARDRFRGVVGIPEVPRNRLSVKTLRSGILRHGCLLVRGLVGPERVHQLVDDIEQAFAAYDAHERGEPTSATAPWFVPFDPPPGPTVPREWVREGDGVLAVDSPRALFDVIEAFDEAGIRELVTSFLGEPPVLLANKWTLRRVEPKGNHDWHQDGAFLGANVRVIDVWVALSHCGVDAPGLDIVGKRLDDIVAGGTDGASFDWSVGDATVRALAPDNIERPVFQPGDALIFDHMLLHRTAVDSKMTRERYAIEAWFAAPSAYPMNAIPIAY